MVTHCYIKLFRFCCKNKSSKGMKISPFWKILIMSSRRLVPPVVTMTLTSMCFASSIQIWLVWRANSRVGTITRAETQKSIHFINCQTTTMYLIVKTLFWFFCWSEVDISLRSSEVESKLSHQPFSFFHWTHKGIHKRLRRELSLHFSSQKLSKDTVIYT